MRFVTTCHNARLREGQRSHPSPMSYQKNAEAEGIRFEKQTPGYLNLCIRSGNQLITSGHVSDLKGKLGAGLTVDDGYQAAYNCTEKSCAQSGTHMARSMACESSRSSAVSIRPSTSRISISSSMAAPTYCIRSLAKKAMVIMLAVRSASRNCRLEQLSKSRPSSKSPHERLLAEKQKGRPRCSGGLFQKG